MRVMLCPLPSPFAFTVHFSVELPAFAAPDRPFFLRPSLHRRCRILRLARRMARYNWGHFSVELPNPVSTYCRFLEDLLVIEGLNEITNTARYHLQVEMGGCFEPRSVADSIARTVRQHFYPDEPICWVDRSASADAESPHGAGGSRPARADFPVSPPVEP